MLSSQEKSREQRCLMRDCNLIAHKKEKIFCHQLCYNYAMLPRISTASSRVLLKMFHVARRRKDLPFLRYEFYDEKTSTLRH